MKTRLMMAAGIGAIIALSGCASKTGEADNTSQEIVVTGDAANKNMPPPPPPPPPPPSVSVQAPAAMESRAYGAVPVGRQVTRPNIVTIDPGTGGEEYNDVEVNPVKLTSEEPVSTFSIDVDTASYANVRRFLTGGTLPPKDAVRIEELVNYFDYAYPEPTSGTHPFQPTVVVTPSPWAEGKELIHIGIQGKDIDRTARPPVNLTMLVDVSGSMRSEDKLPLAKQALKTLLEGMDANDTISIVSYAGAAGEVLAPTKASDTRKIHAALESMNAGGSTAGGEGLRLAYALTEKNFDKNGVNRVMILTDGDFNVGITEDERLEDFVSRKRESGIYLSVMGFGRGNYNSALMQTLAQNGNGIAGYVDTAAEARKLFTDDLAGNMFPIADDVKIQVEFNPSRVAEYRLIGYETRMLKREDFNNDKVDAGDIGAGTSVTAIYEVTSVGSDARLIDERRYVDGSTSRSNAYSSEYGFLKLRYKAPGAGNSTLIEVPINDGVRKRDIANAPTATRFATAVAAYGQLLRGDPYVSEGYDWDDVIALANGAKGEDAFGYRAEFIGLARAAKTAAAQEALNTGGVGE